MKYEHLITGNWLIIVILLAAIAGCSKDDPDGSGYPVNGLVSYYSFDNHLDDLQENSPTAVSYGGVAYIDGYRNRALTFNGINGYLDIDRATFHQDNSFSISFWCKTNEQLEQKSFIHCEDFSVGSFGTTIYLTINAPANSIVYGGFNEATWTHCTGTYDGEYLQIFINGMLHDLYYITFELTENSDNLRIGLVDNKYWEGSLDELFIYNRALNLEEVTALYER